MSSSAYPLFKHKFGQPTAIVSSFAEDQALTEQGWFDSPQEASQFQYKEANRVALSKIYPKFKYFHGEGPAIPIANEEAERLLGPEWTDAQTSLEHF